jgi:hypothetical protein
VLVSRDLYSLSLPSTSEPSARIIDIILYTPAFTATSGSNAFNLSYLRPVIVLFIVTLLCKPVIACLAVRFDLLSKPVDIRQTRIVKIIKIIKTINTMAPKASAISKGKAPEHQPTVSPVPEEAGPAGHQLSLTETETQTP